LLSTEYIRRSTRSFVVNFTVATGQVGGVSCDPTRAEEDFAQYIQRSVATQPKVRKCHFVTDNLNTQQSESLVRYLAAESNLMLDRGRKGERGIF
jgi:hypothetical protein